MEPNAWAAWVAEQYGSARAAVDALSIAPGPRGFEDYEGRAKWQALKALAHAEHVAANEADGRTWGERYLAQMAAEAEAGRLAA
jgi:hypothetical protein